MRVAITAMGLVTPLGAGVDATFQALAGGASAVGGRPPWGGVGPMACFPSPRTSSALALDAARQVASAAPLHPDTALFLGSTSADMVVGERAYGQDCLGQPVDEPLQYLWGQVLHRPARALRRALGLQGQVATFSTACTSSALALMAARDAILAGQAPMALVVGVDALCRTTTSGFGALGVHSPTGARPFDADRDGMSLGEGAAALLIEPEGARVPRAWLAGGAETADAHHLSTPHPDGVHAEAAIRAACAQAGIAPDDIAYVSAHGTGTPLNDATEAAVLERCTPGAPVASLKGALGHTLGAAGAVEALLAAEGLARGVMLPGLGLRRADDTLDHVRQARDRAHRFALSVNFAFGGHNTALVLERA